MSSREKPLCYAAGGRRPAVIAARDRAGRVVQVGYMKRFDPSWRLLAELIDGQGERLRLVSVEVNDPDSWPFVAHRDYLAGDDVPTELIDERRTRRAEQIAQVVGRPLARRRGQGHRRSLLLEHGPRRESRPRAARRHGDLRPARVAGAAVFAGSTGGQGTSAYARRRASGRSSTSPCPSSPTISSACRSSSTTASTSSTFPSPYLNHQPTVLIEKRSERPARPNDPPPRLLRGGLRRGAPRLVARRSSRAPSWSIRSRTLAATWPSSPPSAGGRWRLSRRIAAPRRRRPSPSTARSSAIFRRNGRRPQSSSSKARRLRSSACCRKPAKLRTLRCAAEMCQGPQRGLAPDQARPAPHCGETAAGGPLARRSSASARLSSVPSRRATMSRTVPRFGDCVGIGGAPSRFSGTGMPG